MQTLHWRDLTPDHLRTSGQVQLVHALFDQEDSAPFLSLLSEGERTRAARILNKPAGDKVIITHGILRMVLGRVTNTAPRDLRFSRNAHRKPRLASPSETGIAFNLSHSGNLLLIALSLGAELGVDVEQMDPDRDISAIQRLVFSTEEQDRCARSADSVRDFYTLWTAKEAILKAAGRGFTFPPAKLTVNTAGGLASLDALPPELSSVENCTLTTFHPAQGYLAALAVLSP